MSAEQSCCETPQQPLYLNTQQNATQSSGYTARLQRNAERSATAALLSRMNGQAALCPPAQSIKIQASSGERTQQIQKCFNYVPTITRGCAGIVLQGISAGGVPQSQYIQDKIDDPTIQTPFNPETRFEAYRPYQYPEVPSTIIFTSPTIPVPPDTCLLPGVNISGPNPISSRPIEVIVSAPVPPVAGYFVVSWTPGNDRSVVKYNVYVNGGRLPVLENIEATTVTLGPYSVPSSGTVQIEPVSRNNWRGDRSAIVSWAM